MSFESIKRILPSSMKQTGIEEKANAARIVEQAEKLLNGYWGEDKAAYISVIALKEGQLRVQVRSPAALHGLRLIETKWMNDINRFIGERKVLSIRYEHIGF